MSKKPAPIKTPVYEWTKLSAWIQSTNPDLVERLREVLFERGPENGLLVHACNLYRLPELDQQYLADELGGGTEDYAIWLSW